jgi:Leucine-rich repeat (LRR) protein
MAVQPERKFGLNVNRSFTDIVSRNDAIENIGLNLEDLDVIRNIASEGGVTRNDIRSTAGLDVDLRRYLVKFENETNQYSGIINESAGADSKLRGNLTVNGIFAASAVKYPFLNDSNELRKADVSTSRVSSWSSPDTNPTETSPIFYGGDLDVGGTLTANNINLLEPARPVLFPDSEIPTHKIEANINGQTIFLYAMKGIPVIFEGFFRSFDTIVELKEPGAVSFRIVDIQNPQFTQEYENTGGPSGTSAALTFRDTRPGRKNIEIYHNPANITRLAIERVALEEFPSAEFPELLRLDLYRNILTEFPRFADQNGNNGLAPKLTFLDIRENPFYLADNDNLRFFNQEVTDRLPSTLRELYIGNTFNGPITGDLKNGLPNLVRLELDSHNRGGSRPLFSASESDSPGLPGALPEVSDTVTIYSARRNRFESIPDSVKQLPNLESFDIYGNDITDRNFFIDSEFVRSVNTSVGNQINVANMANKANLEEYRSRRNGEGARRGADPNGLVTPGGLYKFLNCNKLRELRFYASRYEGPIPKFEGNESLNRIDMYVTRFRGGRSFSEQDFVLYDNIFDDCRNSLTFFRVASTSLLSKDIAPDTFSKTPNISYLYIRSYNRGVTGPIPNLNNITNLRRLYLLQNKLTGPVPTFASNFRIFYVNLYSNQLSGAIPIISRSSLRYLFLHYNNLESFNGLLTPNLLRLYINNNNITGNIPDISNLTSLRDLFIKNNDFSSYASNSLIPLTNLRRFDMSNNPNMTQGAINNIIKDLYENYQLRPRSRVAINLRGTATPSGEAVEFLEFLRANGWIVRT